jgi:type I restriction enzyme S subunit
MISDLIKIPPGWQKAKFGEFVINIVNRVDNPRESGLKDYIGLDHLETDEIRIKKFGSTEDVEAMKLLCRKGDIIFGKRNAYLRKVAVADRDAVVSAHSMVLRPKFGNIEPMFLSCFMQSSQFWKIAQAISEGSMSPTIKWKTLSVQEFWLPTLKEQAKIATILWSIEDNIEKTENLLAIVEKLKKGMFEELLTKGTGYINFKKTKWGEIPEEWEIVKLCDICGIMDVDHKIPKSQLTGVSFISAKDLVGDETDISFTDIKFISEEDYRIQAKKCTPRKNDVLYTRTGAKLGIARLVKDDRTFGISSSLCIVRSSEKILPVYLETLLNSDKVHNQAKLGTKSIGVPDLALHEIKKFQVPLSPIEYQLKFVEFTDFMLSYHKLLKNHLTNLKLLKKKSLNSFLSGDLLIPVEDSN